MKIQKQNFLVSSPLCCCCCSILFSPIKELPKSSVCSSIKSHQPKKQLLQTNKKQKLQQQKMSCCPPPPPPPAPCPAPCPAPAPAPCKKPPKKETVRGPTPPPIIKVSYERAPTPEQEYIERVRMHAWSFFSSTFRVLSLFY